MRTRGAGICGLASLLALTALLLAGATAPISSAQAGSEKLRPDLAALVAGTVTLDAAIPPFVQGYVAGEIPFFSVLSEPNDAAHAAELEGLGMRVLRTYRTVEAFALAGQPSEILAAAELPWVTWLSPVELVRTLADPVSEPRNTPSDLGVPALWSQGITGSGVRIAVLDTGVDAAHQDLDDLDFGSWGALPGPAKVIESRNFVGGGCAPGPVDGNGHGSHVAGIATGTGEGSPLATDDGKHAGVAPGAELVVGKVMSDAGTGINSDLVAGIEAMALPADPGNCAFGADVVNMSVGTESRPQRLNTSSDESCGDIPGTCNETFVSVVLNALAVQYGTIFVASQGNSGPFLGSALEAPGSAAQAIKVGAAAKDHDINHDDTLSGDSCAAWLHAPADNVIATLCGATGPSQPPSLASLSSRGPSGDGWLRPDVVAPGYNIVSVQTPGGAGIAQGDLNLGTRDDPLYATASGTSMAAPATAGAAALLLQGYRAAHGGKDPSGKSGRRGFGAPPYVLVRAALMNTAGPDMFEGRWILTTDLVSTILMYPRNQTSDPYVGPLGEGAGKIDVPDALEALRGGIVLYSAASLTRANPGTGNREFQGSWQVGPIAAGSSSTQRFVLHPAPGVAPKNVSFAFEPGHPSDGSRAVPLAPEPNAWTITLPPTTTVTKKDPVVKFSVKVPSSAAPGYYTGTVVATVAGGQTLRIPFFAAVALHDRKLQAGGALGLQATITSGNDVFAKDDTSWPSLVGTPGTGSNADWLVYPVNLAAGLLQAVFRVHDATVAANETYDLYLYDAAFDLIASTHPFASPGVTDKDANDDRGPSTPASPQVLTVDAPAGGRYYVAVSRAKIGGVTNGDFGAFVLKLDEIGS